MLKKRTHDEYVAKVHDINSNIAVVGMYVNNHTKILHRCALDNTMWEATPGNILSGKGCPKCARASRTLTNIEYVKKVSAINSNIEVIGEFVNLTNPIKHKCKIDEYEWMAMPKSILNGSLCPICTGRRKTTESFKQEVFFINPNISIVGNYIDTRTKIKCICLIDGYEWDVLPNSLLRGRGCPMCAGTNRKKQHEYIELLKSINQNIEAVEEYVNAKTSILHRCKICSAHWCATPHNVLRGTGCPVCNESHGERTVRCYLVDKHINFKEQHTFDACKNKKALPFDFYLPDYNVCIEYDGIQHFKPIDAFGGQIYFQNIVKHDAIKTNYCTENNIYLIRIRYDESIKEKLDEFFGIS